MLPVPSSLFESPSVWCSRRRRRRPPLTVDAGVTPTTIRWRRCFRNVAVVHRIERPPSRPLVCSPVRVPCASPTATAVPRPSHAGLAPSLAGQKAGWLGQGPGLAPAWAQPGLAIGRPKAGLFGLTPGLGPGLAGLEAGLSGFSLFLFLVLKQNQIINNYLNIAPKIANKISKCLEKQTLQDRIIEMVF